MSISHFIPVAIPPKHEHRLLGLMLLTLHAILWWDFSNLLTYLLLFVHFFLFIVWQPLWGSQDIPKVKNLLILMVGILIFIIFSNELLINAWQIILLGLMGGRDLVRLRDRVVNTAAIIFLLLELFIGIHQTLVIGAFPTYYFDIQSFLGEFLLLMIPLTFLLISTDDSVEYRYHIDFFHGLTFSLLVIIIILGSFVMMSYEEISYPLAIFQVSLAIALFILVISWLWVFLTGGENIEQLWVRHLFNIGSSFEQWLANLAQPKNYRALTPKQFLHTGFEQLATLPWIAGIAWHSLYGEGFYGHEGKHQVTISVQSVEVTVHARHRINGSHYFHIRLLIQLLEYFHQAKRREEAFAQQAHLQAIHETGAKLTHDIKNLLQSLQAITSAIETCQPEQFGNTQKLLQGQMPLLTQRLKLTLDKFQKPTEFSYSNVPVTLWWSNLQARYGKQSINFFSKIHVENVLVPEDLFDNVVENLLQNALMKRKREPNLHIDVDLYIDKQKLKLTVCDDGSPIPPEIAKDLLLRPLHSRDGFGIGLYQAAKQLAHTGYRLKVLENNEGQVCFELGSSD